MIHQHDMEASTHNSVRLLAQYGRPTSASGTMPPTATNLHFERPRNAEEAEVAAWLRDIDTVPDIFRRAGELLAWREAINVEFASCIGPDSYCNDVSRTIVLCYDLLVEFGRRADLIMRSRNIDEVCTNRPLRYLVGEWIGCPTHDLEGP